MKKIFTINILICLCLWASIAWSAIIPVPTPEYPTIQAGIDAAEVGDIVSVAEGTYEENITLKSGVEVTGAGADVTIITAADDDIVTATSVGFRTSLNGFTIDGQEGRSDNGIAFRNRSSPYIIDIKIVCVGDDGIYCYDYSSPHISYVNISYAGRNGIYDHNYSSPTIGDVPISDAESDGIHGDWIA